MSDDGALTALEPGAADGVPTAEERSARAAAFDIVRQVLAPQLARGGSLRCSPLGPEWSSDIDAHLPEIPDPTTLADAGWLPLTPLLRRIGHPSEHRWAVVDRSGRVLGGVDLTLEPAPAPVDAVLRRIRRRGEVRLRERLELRHLAEAGYDLPSDEALVVRRVPTPRSVLGAVTRPLRRRRTTVGLSGVDGAGKSTLAREVVAALGRAGVPASVVWSRPGMGMGALDRVARAAKRVLGEGTEPGVRRVAAGHGGSVRSRRGAIGWLWALLVVVAHVSDVWRQQLRADGVVVHDRHRLDAHVSLEVLYAGTGLRLHHWLIDAMLPRLASSAHVDVPAEVAVSRKPDDVIGEYAVRRQLEAYGRRLRPDDIRLDGTAPVQANVLRVIQLITVADGVR